MEGVPTSEKPPRLRAARNYRGLTQPDLAAQLDVSVSTLSRWERGEAEVPDRIFLTVGDLCDVPRWFMEHGFNPSAAQEEPALAEDVEALQRQMDTVLQVLAIRVAGAAVTAAAPPRGSEGHVGEEGTGPTR